MRVYTALEGSATVRVGGEGGEEHRLEPGVFIRVGAGEARKCTTGDSPVRVLALGGVPDAPYPIDDTTELGAPDPLAQQD